MSAAFAEHVRAQDRAHRIVRVAIRRGQLTRGECGHRDATCHGRIEGHHEDYGKPLDVIWLCRKHHWQLHTERNRLKSTEPAPARLEAAGTGSDRKDGTTT